MAAQFLSNSSIFLSSFGIEKKMRSPPPPKGDEHERRRQENLMRNAPQQPRRNVVGNEGREEERRRKGKEKEKNTEKYAFRKNSKGIPFSTQTHPLMTQGENPFAARQPTQRGFLKCVFACMVMSEYLLEGRTKESEKAHIATQFFCLLMAGICCFVLYFCYCLPILGLMVHMTWATVGCTK